MNFNDLGIGFSSIIDIKLTNNECENDLKMEKQTKIRKSACVHFDKSDVVVDLCRHYSS